MSVGFPNHTFSVVFFIFFVICTYPACDAYEGLKEHNENTTESCSDLEAISTERIISNLLNEELEPRKKKKEQSLFQRILPMLAMPFIISAMMVPKMLIMLKFMMIQAFIVGKIAITLGIINMLRNRNNQGGVYSHNVHLTPEQKQIVEANYGHPGDGAEYGTYVNSWEKRKKKSIT